MIPAILAAISALKGAEDKKKQQREQMVQSAAQGEAYKYPSSGSGLGGAMQLAGGLTGNDTLGQVGGAMGGQMGGVGNALGSFVHHEPDQSAEPDNDEDDMFGRGAG